MPSGKSLKTVPLNVPPGGEAPVAGRVTVSVSPTATPVGSRSLRLIQPPKGLAKTARASEVPAVAIRSALG